MKSNINNSLEVSDIVKSITNSLCALSTEGEFIDDEFNEIFYELLLWKCKNKIEELTNYRLDNESMKKFLVIDSNGDNIIDRCMILSGIRLSKNSNGFDVAFLDSDSNIYSSKEVKLFIAFTATNHIHLGEKNIRLISEYINVRNLVNPNGCFKYYPRKLKQKKLLLSFVSSTLDKNKIYTESQVNSHLEYFYSDFALIRRDLVDYEFMKRDRNGSEYQVKHA